VTALAVATLETDLDGALALGGRALAFAEGEQRAILASASIAAEALVLGALQREDTLRERSAARFDGRVVRRASTGTEAQLSGAVLYHALALPRVDALFPDASSRTLLNRNLRLILRGYTAAGVPLRYFGTEVLALLGHPVALVGYEQSHTGATLIEVLVGLQSPCVVRPALKREPPASLFSILRSEPAPHELLLRAVGGAAERHGSVAEDVSAALTALPAVAAPAPPCLVPPAAVAIPLGVVEAVTEPSPQITGDLLIGTASVARFEAAVRGAISAGTPLDTALSALQGAALDGARPADLLSAVKQALGSP
jgi:hypothetical protein